jgi:hypothetical protein
MDGGEDVAPEAPVKRDDRHHPQIAHNKLVVITDDEGKFQGSAFQAIPVV